MRYELGSGPEHFDRQKKSREGIAEAWSRGWGKTSNDTLPHIGITTLTSSRRFNFFNFFRSDAVVPYLLSLMLRARKSPAVPLGRTHH